MGFSLLPEAIAQYADSLSRENEVQKALRKKTSASPFPNMQISADQAAFLGFLIKTLAARRVLEIGTFRGYSALTMALSLPSDGRIVSCDINHEYTEDALDFWKQAKVDSKIDLRIAPASETLQALLTQYGEASFDLAFVDANKESYELYYEQSLRLIRPGGIVALDNMLWSGKVVDPDPRDHESIVLNRLNQKIRDDQRVDMSMVSIGDGLMLARKR